MIYARKHTSGFIGIFPGKYVNKKRVYHTRFLVFITTGSNRNTLSCLVIPHLHTIDQYQSWPDIQLAVLLLMPGIRRLQYRQPV